MVKEVEIIGIINYILFFIIVFLLAGIKVLLERRFNSKSRKLETPEEIGSYGEKLIVKTLERLKSPYKVLTNIYLPTKDGTTEIDILLIHPTGLYVIESKNYKGRIYGDGNYKNWVLYLGNKKFTFYNPINQNRNHILALIEVVGDEWQEYIRSYIVFGDECFIKKLRNVPDGVTVIQTHQLTKCLEDVFNELEDVLDSEGLKEMYEYLGQYGDVSEDVKEKHIDDIKKRYA